MGKVLSVAFQSEVKGFDGASAASSFPSEAKCWEQEQVVDQLGAGRIIVCGRGAKVSFQDWPGDLNPAGLTTSRDVLEKLSMFSDLDG